ncbi:DMT family transporter [Tepidimonas sp.]|jgi:drug/metabolite transporter (DMT)-like permease|uniref:DMT family transporter n=1 Tax=Tepidimonas sp. TaxID=2002775 RepID=UPI0028CDB6A4|nr:EamA family transporter [Tepidimonas sp.]MDT7929339.1 EamA family transporter [Tepidimonas sp.]
MSARPATPWLAYGSLAASMALVGSYVALSKPLVAALPVFLLAWLRYLIGAAAMVHWLRKPASEPALDRRTHGLLFLQALLGNFLFSLCMLFGVSLTTASAAGVIMAAIPAVVALQSALFLRERLDMRSGTAVALAAVGIGLFSLDKAAPGAAAAHGTWLGVPLPLWGNALVFAAVVCEAAYVVIGKRLTGQLGARRIAAIINLWGLALMTPLGLWAALRFDGWALLSLGLWALLLFYGLAASVWTVWLWMTGLRHVPAARAGVFTVMLPVSAATIGMLFMGERLTPLQWLAFGVALVGLVVATLPGRTPTRTTDPSAG